MRITPDISFDEREISLTFVRSPGPGGQNVNKVATAAQLRFDVRNSPSLAEDVKRRLEGSAGARLGADGVLRIDAHRYRSQARNRADAIERLADLIRAAAVPPRKRHATRPTAGSRRRRLDAKRRRARLKELRSQPEE